MMLQRETLASLLREAFRKASQSRSSEDPNLISSALCVDIASAYDKWISSATLSTLRPKTIGSTLMAKSLRSNSFSSWGGAFSMYWDSIIWIPTNPSEISAKLVNSQVLGISMQTEITKYVLSRQKTFGTTEEFVDTIVDIVYTYTKKLAGLIVIPTVPGSKPGVVI